MNPLVCMRASVIIATQKLVIANKGTTRDQTRGFALDTSADRTIKNLFINFIFYINEGKAASPFGKFALPQS